MALKDIKTIKVALENRDETIQLWNSFGWDVKNEKHVKKKRRKFVSRQDGEMFLHRDKMFLRHREGERFMGHPGMGGFETSIDWDWEDFVYVHLTFERKPERKNYAELVELEKQYYAPLPPEPHAPAFTITKPGRLGLLWIIITVLVSLSVIGLPIGIIINIWRLVSFPKRLKKWEQEKEAFEEKKSDLETAYSEAKKTYDEAVRRKTDALEKAKSLV